MTGAFDLVDATVLTAGALVCFLGFWMAVLVTDLSLIGKVFYGSVALALGVSLSYMGIGAAYDQFHEADQVGDKLPDSGME